METIKDLINKAAIEHADSLSVQSSIYNMRREAFIQGAMFMFSQDMLYEVLKRTKDYILERIIFELLRDNKISYTKLSEIYVEYLKELKEGVSDNYKELVSKIVHLHCDTKSNQSKNIEEIMDYLADKGVVNIKKI